VGSVITGAAGTLWMLFLGRIIDGASGGSLSVAQAAVADIAPEGQRERLIGGLGAAFGVGFVLGPALGGLAALRGPHVPFYVAAVLAGANAVAALIRLPETRRPTVRAHHERRVPQSLTLRRFAIIGFITTVAFVAFEATFSLFGDRRFGLDEAGTSVIFLCIGLVLVAIQGGAYGRLVERFGVARLYGVGLATMATGLATMAIAFVWPVLVVALGLLAVGQGLASPSITSLVAAEAPAERRGHALGFQQSATAFGRMLGPPAAGAMFDHVAIWSPYVFGAILCAIGLAAGRAWRLFPFGRPVANLVTDG
jgi:MFS family permease